MSRGLLALALALGCAPPQARDDVVALDRGSLVVGVDVHGTLRAVDSDRMGPPPISGIWNYKIAMMAEEGSVVQPGEPVIVFDASDLQRTLDAKIAERDAAATQLELKLAAARVARQDERLGIAEAEAELRKAKVAADVPEGLAARIDLEKARLDREL